jgi:hypothetical protein
MPRKSCDEILLARSIKYSSESSELSIRWMLLINQDNYSESKKTVSAAYSDMFTGDYSSFRKKREKLFHRERLSLDLSQSRQELQSELPKEAIDAWLDCVRSSHGLSTWCEDSDESGGTLVIRWQSPPGVNGPLTIANLEVIGEIPNEKLESLKTIPEGELRFELQRQAPGQIVRGSVTGFVGRGTGAYSDQFYMPSQILDDAEVELPGIEVLIHQQTNGDIQGRGGGWTGIKERSLRMEGFSLRFDRPVAGLDIEYMAHLQGTADTSWYPSGAFCGTRGQHRRLEGVAMRLTGANARRYRLRYAVHVQGIGDLPITEAPFFSGTRGQSRRAESLFVELIRSGE